MTVSWKSPKNQHKPNRISAPINLRSRAPLPYYVIWHLPSPWSFTKSKFKTKSKRRRWRRMKKLYLVKPFKSTYSFSPLGVGDSAFSFQSCYELANSLPSINNCPSWNNISETKELSMLKKVEYEKPPPLHESPAVQRETLPQYWGTEGLTSAETNNITDTMATRDNAWWNVGPFLKVMFLRPARVSPPHLSSLSHTFTYTYILKLVPHEKKKSHTWREQTGRTFC